VARDGYQAGEMVGNRARGATRSAHGLLTATVGFSVAYFFDRKSGPSRRAHLVDLVRRATVWRVESAAGPDDLDLPRIGLARTGPQPTFQRAARDIRAMARA
jgi:hypothetical protein